MAKNDWSKVIETTISLRRSQNRIGFDSVDDKSAFIGRCTRAVAINRRIFQKVDALEAEFRKEESAWQSKERLLETMH